MISGTSTGLSSIALRIFFLLYTLALLKYSKTETIVVILIYIDVFIMLAILMTILLNIPTRESVIALAKCQRRVGCRIAGTTHLIS